MQSILLDVEITIHYLSEKKKSHCGFSNEHTAQTVNSARISSSAAADGPVILSLNQTTPLYWHTKDEHTLYCDCTPAFRANAAEDDYWYQNKAVLLGQGVALHRTCYLFTPSHPPLAPLSTTREQMVHSRRRVIESPWRKCNCLSNYVQTATEQWEPARPQLCVENLERGRRFSGERVGPPLGRWPTDRPTTMLTDPAV